MLWSAVIDSFSPVDRLASRTTSVVLPTVFLASCMSETPSAIPVEPNPMTPLPSVCRNSPVCPSVIGMDRPSITTLPEPLASNSRLSLVLLDESVLPEKVNFVGMTSVV